VHHSTANFKLTFSKQTLIGPIPQNMTPAAAWKRRNYIEVFNYFYHIYPMTQRMPCVNRWDNTEKTLLTSGVIRSHDQFSEKTMQPLCLHNRLRALCVHISSSSDFVTELVTFVVIMATQQHWFFEPREHCMPNAAFCWKLKVRSCGVSLVAVQRQFPTECSDSLRTSSHLYTDQPRLCNKSLLDGLI